MIYTTPNKKVSSILGTAPNEIDTPKQGSDRILLIAVIFLMVSGVLAVYSAIAYFAESQQTTAGALVVRHVVKLGIAFLVILIFSKIDYHFWSKLSRIGVMLSWVLLILVSIYGAEVFGARRSLNIAGFSFQPSSLAIVSLLIHISVMLQQKQGYIKDFKRVFIPIMIWVSITCGLIAIEDFSSAALLMGMCILLMFIGRISTIQLGTLVLIGAIGASAFVIQSAERQSRLDQYFDQIKDIKSNEFIVEEGYQAQQAHIAIAQGEIFGVGIGKSTQRDFLPAPYNDFIFAIIAEEYGLLGSIFLIMLFTVILFRGMAVTAKHAPDVLGTLLAIAATLMLTLYGFVNAGVASGLLPVTGLPMPFISYGGSSMIFAGVMVGILLNISKHNTEKNPVFYA